MLEHGADVSMTLELTIGAYSEEDQVAMNEEMSERAKLNHTAKCSSNYVMKINIPTSW